MESYTFRCSRSNCPDKGKIINGVTMGHVVDAGTPICQQCGDDLELVGPDDGADAQKPIVRSKVWRYGRNQPTAYSAVPGPPVNPEIGG